MIRVLVLLLLMSCAPTTPPPPESLVTLNLTNWAWDVVRVELQGDGWWRSPSWTRARKPRGDSIRVRAIKLYPSCSTGVAATGRSV